MGPTGTDQPSLPSTIRYTERAGAGPRRNHQCRQSARCSTKRQAATQNKGHPLWLAELTMGNPSSRRIRQLRCSESAGSRRAQEHPCQRTAQLERRGINNTRYGWPIYSRGRGSSDGQETRNCKGDHVDQSWRSEELVYTLPSRALRGRFHSRNYERKVRIIVILIP